MPEAQRPASNTHFKQRQERRKAVKAAAQVGPSGASVAPMDGQGTKAQSVLEANPKSIPQAPTNPIYRLNGQAQAPRQPGPPNEAQVSHPLLHLVDWK